MDELQALLKNLKALEEKIGEKLEAFDDKISKTSLVVETAIKYVEQTENKLAILMQSRDARDALEKKGAFAWTEQGTKK